LVQFGVTLGKTDIEADSIQHYEHFGYDHWARFLYKDNYRFMHRIKLKNKFYGQLASQVETP